MKRVKIADLKNNLSRHLTHVRDGGDLVVLDRDTPIARIVPFGRPEDDADESRKHEYWTSQRLAEMEAQGVITRGHPQGIAEWLSNHRPVKLPAGTPSAVGLLLKMRRDSTR